jgi:hypothetical protein
MLGIVRPQDARNRSPLDGPAMQRQERQQTLRGPRNSHHARPLHQAEPTQHGKNKARVVDLR